MKTFFRCLLISACLFGAVASVRAEDLTSVRARMEQRVPSIDALKKQGVLGENNRGFLDVRSGSDGGVAAAENKDRTEVYAAIATKVGTAPESVGKARARRIAAASAAGVWVQDENGQWAKK